MTLGTVLVVTADDRTHALVGDTLKHAGFGVVRVYDSVSALCVQAALMLDAVVASSNVPGLEGTAFLRVVRLLDAELPLLFLTDRPARDTEARAIADGASGYFLLPLDAATLDRVRLGALALREVEHARRVTRAPARRC